MFQSTPVIADGRARERIVDALQRGEFQSTPVIADGRANLSAELIGGDGKVSIHARHC